jgi:hypothetical protein
VPVSLPHSTSAVYDDNSYILNVSAVSALCDLAATYDVLNAASTLSAPSEDVFLPHF